MATKKSLPDFDYRDRVGDGRKAELDAFAEKVGIKAIKDYNLFNRAFSHKSFTNEQGWSHNEQYEKLEFFGDSVLGLVINEYLFKSFPDYEEGDLSKIKSACVSEPSLAEAAKSIDLGALILIGRGETRGAGTERPSLLADVFEAVIGAVYLDQGLPTARKFVLSFLKDSVHALSDEDATGDHKSYFQEIVQKDRGLRPHYTVMKSSGPDHSRKFKIAVTIGGKRWGIGEGKSKKEAEQDAAEKGLKAWQEARKAPRKGRGRREDRGGERPEGAERSSTQPRDEGARGESSVPSRNGRRRPRGARARQLMREVPLEEVIAQGVDPVAAAAGLFDYPFRRSAPAAVEPESDESPIADGSSARDAEQDPEHASTDRGAAPGDGSDRDGEGRRRKRRGRRGGRRRGGRDDSASASRDADLPERGNTRKPPEDHELVETESGSGEPVDGPAEASDAEAGAGGRNKRRRRGGRGRRRAGSSGPASPEASAPRGGERRREPRPESDRERSAASPRRDEAMAGAERKERPGRGRGRARGPARDSGPAEREERRDRPSTASPADDPIAWAAGESFTRKPRKGRR